MIEGIDISSLITAVPVIGVLLAWLASMRTRNQDLQERYDRLDAEYKQNLKEQAGHRTQQIINERILGLQLGVTDSQKISSDMLALVQQSKADREQKWHENG